MDAPALSQVIRIGCEAGLDAAAWRGFTNATAEAFGCQLAVFEIHDRENPEKSFLVAGGLDGFEDAYKSIQQYQREDDLYWQGVKDQPSGTVRLGTEIVAPDFMRRHRLYSAIAMPWHLEHFLFGAVTTGGPVSAYLSLGRTERESPFVDGDKSIVSKLLLPHLGRSITVQHQLDVLSSAHVLLSSALNQSPDGIVVFDGGYQPIFISQEASAVFAAGDGLTLVNGGLHTADPAVRAQLTWALSTAQQSVAGEDGKPPAVVTVGRAGDSGQYQVVFLPLNRVGGHANFAPMGGVMAVIRGPKYLKPADLPKMLTAAFGLSRAEVGLCLALLGGKALQEAATSLDVSRNTVKTHLARIFEKTGVHSQAALLRLLTMRFGTHLPNRKDPSINGSGAEG